MCQNLLFHLDKLGYLIPQVDELSAYRDKPILETCVASIDAAFGFIPSSGLSEVACNIAPLLY